MEFARLRLLTEEFWACAELQQLAKAATLPTLPILTNLPQEPQVQPETRFEREYERMHLLGRGGFGEVWQCRNRLDGQEYAVKAVETFFTDSKDLERRVLREVNNIWASPQFSHPNIVRYHTSWVEIDGSTAPLSERLRVASASVSTCVASRIGTDHSVDVSFGGESDGGIVFEETAAASQSLISQSMAVPRSKKLAVASPALLPRSEVAVEASVSQLALRTGPARQPLPKHRAVLYIQMELCRAETLQDWIARRNAAFAAGAKPDERRTWALQGNEILKQCLSAVAHLEKIGQVHRDIKPANILFAKDGTVRLADFGLLTPAVAEKNAFFEKEHHGDFCANSQGVHTRGVGTASYASPEQLLGKIYGCSADVFALGVVVAELLCPVRTEMERAALFRALREGHELPAAIMADFPKTASLILKMTGAPEVRPSAGDVLASVPEITSEVLVHFFQPASSRVHPCRACHGRCHRRGRGQRPLSSK